ncbi:hypothetical protein JB92DRAFT_3085578 [Gautieria morchelliformis]|nr:hypothetical protein JB92DRAFT_3085578 [Gautieria morchelliformis]
MPGVRYQENPCVGPLWMPSDSDMHLGCSWRETAVLDLAQGLDQYLGVRDVPAHENSDEDSQGGSDSSGDKALELPIQQDVWTCSLDILMHLPRSVFSRRQLDIFLWMLKVNGMDDVPSVKAQKLVNASIQHLCGIDTVKYNGATGHKFYVNNLAQLIAQMANPRVQPHLHFYPEDTSPHLSEARQAHRWLSEVDGDLLTLMVRHGSQEFFTFEPALLKDQSAVMPFRWFGHGRQMFAKAWRLHPCGQMWVVLEYEVLTVALDDFLLNFVEFGKGHMRYDCPSPTEIAAKWMIRLIGTFDSPTGTPKEWTRTDTKLGNCWRDRGKGHRVVAAPIWLYCDDTSGNTSKKWNKHNSFLFTMAGLDREHAQQEYNVHFLCTSNIAPPLEMLEAIVAQVLTCQSEGIWAWDCEWGEMVLVLVWMLALVGDNPMQSEMACHRGLLAKFFCRCCWVKGSDTTQHDAPGVETQSSRGGSSPGVYNDPNGGSSGGGSSDGAGSARGLGSEDERQRGRGHKIVESMATMVSRVQHFMVKGVPRDKYESQAYLGSYYEATTMVRNQMRISKAKTTSGVQDAYQDYFIKKLQGAYQTKRGRDAKQKALDEAVEALPSNTTSPVWLIKGLDPHRDMPVEILHVVLLGFVKYFWRDAVTRVKKAKMQHVLEARLQSCDVAPFVLYDLLPAEVVAAWAALAWLVPMIWQPVIVDSELHVRQLQLAIDHFLDCTVRWTPRWFNKPKFHILLHLTEDIWRFGPLFLFATEGFESFNAVIQAQSVHSNRHAPLRDITLGFSQGNRIRHLVSGGAFNVVILRVPGLSMWNHRASSPWTPWCGFLALGAVWGCRLTHQSGTCDINPDLPCTDQISLFQAGARRLAVEVFVFAFMFVITMCKCRAPELVYMSHDL